MRGDAREMHPPSRELDEEQDVERLEHDRLDGEEVAREDAMGLRGEELASRGTGPARCRTEAVAQQHGPDGAR
jgi:hypothetical protein